MDRLLVKRAQVQLNSVTNAKETLELREMELLAEIDRIKKSIEIQDKEIEKLTNRLNELKEE